MLVPSRGIEVHLVVVVVVVVMTASGSVGVIGGALW